MCLPLYFYDSHLSISFTKGFEYNIHVPGITMEHGGPSNKRQKEDANLVNFLILSRGVISTH